VTWLAALDALRSASRDASLEEGESHQAGLLRDICGNPWRPIIRQWGPSPIKKILAGSWTQPTGIVFASWLLWNDRTIPRLAQAAYDERISQKCHECNSRGKIVESGPYGYDKTRTKCKRCSGTGRIDDGTLDPVRLAILADALEEAGCDNADILTHCRQSGPHVRGCWVVDLLLGRE
jgi:hypothetical protein